MVKNIVISDGRGRKTRIGGQPPITSEPDSLAFLSGLVQSGAWVAHEGRWLGWSERLAYARSRLARSSFSTTEAALLALLSQMSSLEMQAASNARLGEMAARAQQLLGPTTTTAEPTTEEEPDTEDDDVDQWLALQVPPEVQPEPNLDLLK